MTIVDLYVNSYNSRIEEWTPVGSSPFFDIQDQPTNYVHVSVKTKDIGDFGFEDLPGSPSIISVNLYLYCDCGSEKIIVNVWDGAGWTPYTFQGSGWAWRNLDVSTTLDTDAKVDGALIYLESKAIGGWGGSVQADCTYLKVDYAGVVPKDVTDSMGLSDAMARDKQFLLSDVIGLNDVLLSDKQLLSSDAMGLTGVQFRDKEFTLTDSLGLGESIYKDRTLLVLDNMGLTDQIFKSLMVSIVDTIGLTDTQVLDKLLTISDIMGLTDVLVLDKVLEVIESFGLTDTLLLDKILGVSDGLGLTDSFLLGKLKEVLDSLGLSDSLKVDKALIVIESMGITDTIFKKRDFIVVDSLGLEDSLLKNPYLISLDSFGISELVDVEILAVEILKEVTDQMGITESILIYVIIPIPFSHLSTLTIRQKLQVISRLIKQKLEVRKVIKQKLEAYD